MNTQRNKQPGFLFYVQYKEKTAILLFMFHKITSPATLQPLKCIIFPSKWKNSVTLNVEVYTL